MAASVESVAAASAAPTVAEGAPSGKRAGRGKRIASLAGTYALLVLLALVILYPVWMAVVRAISAPFDFIDAGQPPYPVAPEWDIFDRAFTEGNFDRAFLVSFLMTSIIVVGQVITSIMAAYAFAFLRFPLKNLLFVLVVATLMLPVEVTLIPNIQLIRELDWLNTVQGLTLPFLATAFGIFLIRQGFLGIPKELRDAATLDGYGHWGFLFKVAIPVTRPIIASFTVISFLAAWNQYLWPRAVVTEGEWNTVQIALRSLSGTNPEELNIGFAGALLAAVPILILLILFQRHIIRGLTAGAVKG